MCLMGAECAFLKAIPVLEAKTSAHMPCPIWWYWSAFDEFVVEGFLSDIVIEDLEWLGSSD